MNNKPQTQNNSKGDNGDSSVKQLIISLIATTISIILTFGTAAVIDNYKKKSEKHEMLMMIFNDLNQAVNHIQDIDSAAVQSFEAQISILENPETFEQRKFDLLSFQFACSSKPLKTVESIFSSNIETINTLGNIIFVEKVSEFYLIRQEFFDTMSDMLKDVYDEENGILSSYDNLANHNLTPLVTICDAQLKQLKKIMEQCKQMMNVSDEEIAAFSRQREEMDIFIDKSEANDNLNTMIERNRRFDQAVEKGRLK